MSEEREVTRSGRRNFLKLAGSGAAGSVAVATGGAEPAQAAGQEPAASGYRETPHVKKVYELSRF